MTGGGSNIITTENVTHTNQSTNHNVKKKSSNSTYTHLFKVCQRPVLAGLCHTFQRVCLWERKRGMDNSRVNMTDQLLLTDTGHKTTKCSQIYSKSCRKPSIWGKWLLLPRPPILTQHIMQVMVQSEDHVSVTLLEGWNVMLPKHTPSFAVVLTHRSKTSNRCSAGVRLSSNMWMLQIPGLFTAWFLKRLKVRGAPTLTYRCAHSGSCSRHLSAWLHLH